MPTNHACSPYQLLQSWTQCCFSITLSPILFALLEVLGHAVASPDFVVLYLAAHIYCHALAYTVQPLVLLLWLDQ